MYLALIKLMIGSRLMHMSDLYPISYLRSIELLDRVFHDSFTSRTFFCAGKAENQ